MNCSKIMDTVYEYDDNSMPLLDQMLITVHTFFCSSCAQEIERLQSASTVMKEDFFPELPRLCDNSMSSLEDSVMLKIADEIPAQAQYPESGVFSTKGWVIAGLVLMVSLVSAFFGFDFKSLASETGMSFMLPMGITIGIILTVYGVIFIGSHLKELSERFGL